MRKLLLTFALATVAGAALAQNTPAAPPKPAAPVIANPAAPPMPPRMEMTRSAPCILPTLRLINSQMAMRLPLTDDQKTKVAELLDKADKDIKPKIDAQAKLGQDYVSLLAKPDVSQPELTAAADKAMKAETDVLMTKINTLFALKALLTPDQNKQLAERLAQYSYPWRGGVRPMLGPSANPAPNAPAPTN